MAASSGARLLFGNSARRSLGDFTKLLPKVLRLQLHRGGPDEMARRPEHGARPWRALSSDDQGKIERWHQTLKNRILLENYYLPGDISVAGPLATMATYISGWPHPRWPFLQEWPEVARMTSRVGHGRMDMQNG